MSVIIKAVGLVKYYGDFAAVNGVDFEIRAGEFWGLLGPNGAGKTTLLRMLTGNTPATAGELEVLGFDIPRQATTMRRRIGVVPQQDNLDPDFTVSENLPKNYRPKIKSTWMFSSKPYKIRFRNFNLKPI
jgi:lipooligosaccharide transport system ATP-binding protein